MDAARLARFDVLSALDDEARDAVAAVAQELEVEAGAELTRTGEFGYHLFFVEEGEVDVLRDGDVVATLGPGRHFGEVALLVTGQRTADVRTRTGVKLVVVFDRDLRELDRRFPELGHALRAASAPRLPGAAPR